MSEGSEPRRLLHTMIRVRDLEKSVDFYTRLMGMKLLRQKDYADGRFTLAFVGFGDEADQAVIELTHNWDQDTDYDLGNGFGHLAILVSDTRATCSDLEKEGVPIPRPPGPMKFGRSAGGSAIAFIKDPDGYLIELIQRA